MTQLQNLTKRGDFIQMKTVAELEAKLSEASDRLISDLYKVDGDLLILGAGGKMGPSLAKLAAQAIKAGGMP